MLSYIAVIINRYEVPFLCFINKCDRPGAKPYRVVDQIRYAKEGIGNVPAVILLAQDEIANSRGCDQHSYRYLIRLFHCLDQGSESINL